MTRGKKAKRKIGGRRKPEVAVSTPSIRLPESNGVASGLPINKARARNISKGTTMTSSPIKIDDNPSQIIVTGLLDSKSKSDDRCSIQRIGETKITINSFAISFKSDELQTLRSVLHRTDLSKTPLLLGAIILGKVDVVKRLLRDGYPINSRSDEDKTTALMWAVRNKDLAMINLLVRYGADLTLLDENDDNVALIAVQSSSWEQNDFLDFWTSIDRKIDLGHANTSGYTILHYAKERQWDVLTDLIGNDPKDVKKDNSILSNSCICCYCSASTTSTGYNKGKENETSKIFPPEDIESTLSHLTALFEDIVNRYRLTWARDRELGYPGFRGGHGDSAATLEDLMSLRRSEIARLNTVLPKLEESYLLKLRDCWTSLVTKMKETGRYNYRKFEEYVTSIQIQLLTHEISPKHDETVEFSGEDQKRTAGIAQVSNKSNCPEYIKVLEESNRKFNFPPDKTILNPK